MEHDPKVVLIGDDGREVILSILGENDFFGEMSILDGLARSASVVARPSSRARGKRRPAGMLDTIAGYSIASYGSPT